MKIIFGIFGRLINFGLEVEGFADQEVIILSYDETKDKSLKDERFEGKKKKNLKGNGRENKIERRH